MDRSHAIVKSLSNELTSDYQLAPLPDHPYLLSGPNILVGGSGRLTAIFLIGKATSHKALYSRITACRLALPLGARVVFLGTEERFPTFPASFMRNADAVFPLSGEHRSLARYLRSDAKAVGNQPDLAHAKLLHAARWSAAAQLTLLRRQQVASSISAEGLVRELRSRHDEQQLKLRRYGQALHETTVGGSVIRALRRGPLMMNSLRNAWVDGLRATYTLDDGVPYSDIDAPPSVLLVDTWPRNSSDPEKPLRSAAFGGWVMASSDSSEDVEYLVARAQGLVRRKVRERTQG